MNKKIKPITRHILVGVSVLLAVFSPLAVMSMTKADTIAPELLSVNAEGAKADYGGGNVYMSRDGRYVSFESVATNLGRQRTTGGNNNLGPTAIYLRDRQTGTTTLESVNTAGEQENSNNAIGHRLTGDGRHIVFVTDANNMGQTQSGLNAYLRDLDQQTTTLVGSMSIGNVNYISASNDGSIVAYGGNIRNMTTGNNIANCTGHLISHVSGNGQYVVYETYNTSTSSGQVYRCDVNTGETVLVTATPDGNLSNGTAGAGGISDDGNRVIVNSTSTTFFPDGRPRAGAGRYYVRDIAAATTQRIDVKTDGSDATDEHPNFAAYITGDGNLAYFISAHRLTDDAFVGDGYHVYTHNLATHVTTLVNRNAWGVPADSESYSAAMDHDGSLVAFESNATNFGNYEHLYSQVYAVSTAPYTGVTDTTAPSITNLAWANNPVAAGTDAPFTITVADNLSGVVRAEFWVDAEGPGLSYEQPLTRVDGTTFTGIVASQSPGIHQVGVRVMDAGNNWSETAIDYLVVYDAGKTKMRGQGAFIPTYGTDTLPGLIQSGQTDKGKMGMLIVYKNGVVDATKSALTFTYNTGVRCAKPTASNCHAMSLTSSAISWLVLDQENSSHGTVQGVASVTIDGVTTTNPIRVEGIDGARLSSPLVDHYAIKVYAPGANPATAQPIYHASGDLVKGNVRIVAPATTPPPPPPL